jgi:hypothetical protein
MTVFTPLKQTEKNLLKKSIYLMFMKEIITVKIICIKFYHTGPFKNFDAQIDKIMSKLQKILKLN